MAVDPLLGGLLLGVVLVAGAVNGVAVGRRFIRISFIYYR